MSPSFEFAAACVLLLVMVLAAYLVLARGHVATFVFTPFGLFAAFFGFQYFVVPLVQLASDEGRFGLFNAHGLTDSSFESLALYAAYFVAAFAAYAWRGRRPLPDVMREVTLRARGTDTAVLRTVVLVFLGAVVLNVVLVIPLILSDYSTFLIDRISLLSGYGYVIMPLILSVPILVMLAAVAYRRKSMGLPNGRLWLLVVLVAVPSVLMNLLLGGRSSAMLNLIYPVFAASLLFIRRRNLRQVVMLAFAAVLALQLVTALGKLRRAAVMEGFGGLQSGYSSAQGATLARELTISLGHGELLAYLIENEGQWQPAYGKTYVAALVVPVPRALWPGKPLGGGPYLQNIVDPNSYVVGMSYLTSLLTGAPLEAYLNFGIPGIIAMGLLHGFAMALVSRRAAKAAGATGFAIYITLVLGLGFEFVYGEFLGALVRMGTMLVPLYLTQRVLRQVSRRRQPGVVGPLPQHAPAPVRG